MAALTPQNYHSDFTFVEKFYKLGSNNDLVADKIPDITIDFEFVYRAEPDRSFKAGRKNGEYFNCKPLDDASIEVFIPLSRNSLGTGELFHELKLYTPNDDFPESIQRICIPASTGIILHKGASVPLTTSIAGNAIVAAILAGKSAYEIAVEKYGYEGTEEEYVKASYRALDLLQNHIGLPSFNAQDYTLTFTAQNGAQVIIDLPLETMGLDYDANTKEMIYTRADGTKRRIPLTEFIDIYVGSIGNEIQITVEEKNVIRAQLLDGAVAWSKLSYDTQSRINSKQNATDYALATQHKTIVGAINELNSALQDGAGVGGNTDVSVVINFYENGDDYTVDDPIYLFNTANNNQTTKITGDEYYHATGRLNYVLYSPTASYSHRLCFCDFDPGTKFLLVNYESYEYLKIVSQHEVIKQLPPDEMVMVVILPGIYQHEINGISFNVNRVAILNFDNV